MKADKEILKCQTWLTFCKTSRTHLHPVILPTHPKKQYFSDMLRKLLLHPGYKSLLSSIYKKLTVKKIEVGLENRTKWVTLYKSDVHFTSILGLYRSSRDFIDILKSSWFLRNGLSKMSFRPVRWGCTSIRHSKHLMKASLQHLTAISVISE